MLSDAEHAERAQIASVETRALLTQIRAARMIYPAIWQKLIAHAPASLVRDLERGLLEWQTKQDQIDRGA